MEKREEQALAEVRRNSRFLHAFRGLYIFYKGTRNVVVYIGVSIFVIFFGFYFQVSSVEWMMLVFAIGLVFICEAFNTAIEIDIDLTSPEYHPYARDTKDVAAGAVLLAVLVAVFIGGIVFLPKLF